MQNPKSKIKTTKMKTEYNHGNLLGISNIWQDRSTWAWSNRAGESCGEPSFEAAVTAAESVLLEARDKRMATEALRELSPLLTEDQAEHVVVCEFSAEDDTPTLHVYLWRGLDISDLPSQIASLRIASEGHWDGGRTYSLQLDNFKKN